MYYSYLRLYRLCLFLSGTTDVSGEFTTEDFKYGQMLYITARQSQFEDTLRYYRMSQDAEQSLSISMSPLFLAGEKMRATLNWGPDPLDLDLHAVERDRTYPRMACEVFWRYV